MILGAKSCTTIQWFTFWKHSSHRIYEIWMPFHFRHACFSCAFFAAMKANYNLRGDMHILLPCSQGLYQMSAFIENTGRFI